MLGAAALTLVLRETGATEARIPVSGPGVVDHHGLEVEVSGDASRFDWSVANTGDRPRSIDAVGLEWDLPAGSGPVRMFVHGYQSWSPSGLRILGRDEDPSQHPDRLPFTGHVHHADPGTAEPGELRSEQVTVLDLADGGPRRCLGFLDGASHAGTFRARRDGDQVRVRAEGWLGGAVLPAGAARTLHPVVATSGDDPSALLASWAAAAGAVGGARTGSPYVVGWCSWYHYFHGVSEDDVRHNLARAGDWPFEVFQIDDGFQAAIGDWLHTNERFPSGLERLAADITATGRQPGLWLAPFLAAPDSQVARTHPGWFARHPDLEGPLPGMVHPEWGGIMWELDTTDPEVLAHLETTAATLVAAGYRYLKLDFTFSPTMPGRYADPTRTPAERVRAGYEAVRRGAGDEAFVLGCGCPLGAVVGVVDAMRIGPDVAPSWLVGPDDTPLPGYEAAAPSVRNAWADTLARSFQHRRLWLNDPDCLMLRRSSTRLGPGEIEAWALAVGLSGGLALVSDDLALVDERGRALLDEVLALGRAADAAAASGPPPRCPDLLDAAVPGRLEAAGRRLVADPDSPRPRIEDCDPGA